MKLVKVLVAMALTVPASILYSAILFGADITPAQGMLTLGCVGVAFIKGMVDIYTEIK